jgi:hypothetical protein
MREMVTPSFLTFIIASTISYNTLFVIVNYETLENSSIALKIEELYSTSPVSYDFEKLCYRLTVIFLE